MKWLQETRSVAIADIRKPDDWDAVMAEDRTKELAANLKHTAGPVSLPVLHGATMTIIAGSHRIAAMAIGGETHVTCRLFLGDTVEEEVVRSSDNAFPRDDYDGWVDRRVKALAALIEKQRSELGQPVQVGRKTTETEAREMVARETKSTPEAVRKRQERLHAPEKKLDVRTVDAEGTETSWAEPAETNEAPPVPKPRSFEARLKDFLPKPGQDPDCLLNDLYTAILDAETWSKRWAGQRDAHKRLIPAAQVHMYVCESRDLLVRVWDKTKEVVRLLGIIRAQTHAKGSNPVTEGPKVGLGGRTL